ncbi:thioredoxin domain-containing protein, partial [Rhizobium leguminosarum]|uniref:thioredoxin domain-containing protein n=1 Tax=Rhizobium leguminosarum TaxID=384 RepID=UPI003F94E591
AHFHNTVFDTIKQKYVDSGKFQFIIREFPFDPRAAAAFMLARFNSSNPEQFSTPEQYFPMVSMLFKQRLDEIRLAKAVRPDNAGQSPLDD